MTPDERQLIQGLFDRMHQNGPADKDREAESFINQAVRQTPDAAYLLVQSVLAQEHYLQEAGARIEDLEARMRELEDRLQSQQSQPQKSSGGSFLGGLFGGSKPAPQPQPRASASVPSFGARPQAGQAGSPWGNAANAQPQGGYGQQPMQQQAPAGGGFMRSALTTAAGVAGGMLAANAIQGMLGGGSNAHASGHSPSTPATSEASPFAVDSAADRQREIDHQQDAQQDAEMESEQAFFDDSSGSDDTEY